MMFKTQDNKRRLLSAVLKALSWMLTFSGPFISVSSKPQQSMLSQCPPTTLVIGMRVNYQPYDGPSLAKDDVGITGIELQCGYPSEDPTTLSTISGDIYVQRKWTNISYCNGVATGIQIKSAKPKGIFDFDGLGASSVVLYCEASPPIELGLLDLDAEDNEIIDCPLGQGIASIRTVGSKYKSRRSNLFRFVDNVGLTDVKSTCLPVPFFNCTAYDIWESTGSYDNSHSNKAVTFKYKLKTGVGQFEGNTESINSSTTNWGTGGVLITVPVGQIRTKFKLNVGTSKTTGYNWERSSESTWSKEISTEISVQIPPGETFRVDQVVGVCGKVIAFTDNFRTSFEPKQILKQNITQTISTPVYLDYFFILSIISLVAGIVATLLIRRRLISRYVKLNMQTDNNNNSVYGNKL